MQGEQEDEVLDQHALLPSMQDDPKLWMVKVRAGSEKAIVSLLMSRFLVERFKNKPWGVTSAFCQEMPPRALSALCCTFRLQARLRGAPHSWKQPMCPPYGVYKGDLAQVEEVDVEGGVTVKVIPRIDYQAVAERCPSGLVLPCCYRPFASFRRAATPLGSSAGASARHGYCAPGMHCRSGCRVRGNLLFERGPRACAVHICAPEFVNPLLPGCFYCGTHPCHRPEQGRVQKNTL